MIVVLDGLILRKLSKVVMKAEIIEKKSGARRQKEDAQNLALTRPSVVFLKLAPENVARFERRGDDLVLVLKDGQEILIQGFFVKFPEEASTEASADAAHANSDDVPAEEQARSELVLEDDNGVVWWGQYPEQWSEFHFTEIEWHDAGGFIWWPYLLGALGGVALAGALGGKGGGDKAHPPVAVDDTATGNEDGGPITGNVLGNDRDPDGDALTVTQFTIGGTTYKAGETATIPGVGTLKIDDKGSYTFTPEANWNGTVPTATYTVSDDNGGTDTANLTIIVNPVADLTAADDSNVTDEDTPVSGSVASNDSASGGGDLTFAKASDPSNGTVTVNPDGSYTYTPNSNFNGTDSFTYTVFDPGSGESRTQTVVITVNSVNDAPVSVGTIADQGSVDAQSIITMDASVYFTDVDGEALTYSASGLPQGLTINPVTGVISGTIDNSASQAGAGGVYSVTITTTDGDGASSTQTFSWTVTNPPPQANDDAAITNEDTAVSGNVLGATGAGAGDVADSDPDGDSITVTGFTIAGDATPHSAGETVTIIGVGSFTLDSTGGYTFTLEANWHGTVPTVTYTISDGEGGSATANLVITVTSVNDAPVANADSNAVTEAGVTGGGNTPTAGIGTASGNVLGNDTDVDAGDTATLQVNAVNFGGVPGTLGSPLLGTYGSLELNPDGTYIYTLNNSDPDTQALKQGATATEIFSYTVTDVNGGTSTSTLTITVTGTNDRPIITSTTADATGEVTEVGTSVAGNPTATGTLTASDVDTDATKTWSVATTSGTYGTISINPTTGEWTYTLDNARSATQNLNDGDTGTETFTARVTDEFGAYSDQVITITVNGSNDDLAGSGDVIVPVTEDGAVSGTLQDYVSDMDDVIKVTGFTVDADGDGTDEPYSPGDTVTIKDGDGNTLGTLIIEEDGGYSFTPAANYAGTVPTVTYTMAETSGGSSAVTQTLDFAITKVADAPGLEGNKTVNTDEDTSVSLGLIAPVIADTGTGTGNNDYSERLGAITLTISGAGASGVTLSTGAETLGFVSNTVTIVLTDVDHVASVPAENNANGIYYLTTAEYQALVANPRAESGRDFTITVSATSYEVDATGVPLSGVTGATSTQTINVDVLAVTDGATLAIDVANLTVAEDTAINISSHLTPTLTSSDANAGNDTDGSETYWYTVTGLPVGSVVTIGGVHTTITSTSQEVSSVSSTSPTPPVISVTPPSNFSGDIGGITVTLKSRDTDSDSTGTINTTLSSVALDLHVTPVAGDVSVADVTGSEDTEVAFLAGVTITDTDTGGEVINSITFTVPTGWELTTIPVVAGMTVTGGPTGSMTISFTGMDRAAIESALDAFKITPPAHSSADTTIALSIEMTDGSTPEIHTATISETVTITVNPVAERTDVDSDGAGGNDVTLIGDYAYTTPGKEDTWYALGTNLTGASNTVGHDLLTGWSNEDSDEFTYAVLTPTLVADAAGDSVIGTQFRYSTDGGTTWVTRTYVGEPIWAPQQYLDTLQVRLPADVSGTLTIGVQAGTVDYDDDADASTLPLDPPTVSGPGVSVNISGSATLSLVKFDPVADAVTMALNGRASGFEDTAIPLAIKTTSSDSSETFNVTIAGVPNGAKIVYNGTELTVTGGSVTIANFSNTAPLTITPPPNSNDDFTLSVSAVSVDGGDTSAVVSRNINVSVTGVADEALVTLPMIPYTVAEATLDAGNHKVALSDLVTSVTSPDTDGSETVTVRITGLTEEFSITGATMVASGTGAERVWVVSASNLANVSIVVPENYSGSVGLKVAGVTTENDGDSLTTGSTDVIFTVSPSPEATITTSATLVEDEITPLNLAIIQQNGDTNETLGNIYVPIGYDTSTYTLYLSGTALSAAGLGTTVIGGATYYVIPAAQVDELGARGTSNLDGGLGSLNFQYEVIDPSSDGSLAAVTEIKAGTLTLTATPITDAVDASITAIDMTGATGTVANNTPTGDDADPDTATVTVSGSVTVNLHVDSDDTDGSEHLIRVLIEGVPDGVTVTGASQVGSGSWLLVYDGSSALSIGAGGIELPVEFIIGRGAGDGTSTITMTVQAQDEGNVSATPASIETDAVSWNLVLDLADGAAYTPPLIDEWRYNGAIGTEDAAFALGSVIDAAVSTSDPAVAYSFTVTVTDIPAGSTVNGMVLTYIGGEAVYTATVTVAPGGDSQAALDALLAGITIIPPANSNDNNADFSFDAKLTAAAVGGTSVVADTNADMPVTPVTDTATITVTTSDVGEGTSSVTATIDAQDIADGSYGRIVDGKLYVQVSTHGNDGGTVSSGGVDLTLTSVSGVAGIPDGGYYVIDIGTSGGSVDIVYTAATGTVLEPGDVMFAAYTQTQETGAGNVVSASSSGTAAVKIINNGVTIASQVVTDNEATSSDKSNAIELSGLSVALNDNDGSETIQSILLSGVPVGFLLYVGNTAGDATLAAQASNAGGDGLTNTWILSSNGTLPAYVAILPATHWSGTLPDLALIVESGETSLSTTRVDTIPLETVTVEAVANGVTIDPTISFGTEGSIIDLNLNASMADAVAAAATVLDGSTETTTLQITGAGEFAAFYIGDDLLTSVAYDAGTDTYTITGLSQDALDDLGMVQAASSLTDQDTATNGTQVRVTAWTVESGNGAESVHVSDTLTLALTPVVGTTGNDSFIWDGEGINGRAGIDTVALRYGEDVSHADLANRLRNVEVIDLSVSGENSITGGLSIADVLNITGSSTGTLTINGDVNDRIELSSASEWSTTGTVTNGHVAYTSTSGVTLLIDEDIYNNGHVSYAA